MNEPFELPVSYKGVELMLPAQLLQHGYTHKFKVDVYGQEVFFEQDEGGDYRAMSDPALLDEKKEVDINLLKAIAASIEIVIK